MKYKLFDQATNKDVAVVLSARNDLVDSLLTNDEKIRSYRTFLKESDTKFCFIRGSTFYHSSDQGVHLASQIEEVAARNDLSSIDVCFQAETDIYIARLNADGIVVEEEIISNLADSRIPKAIAIGKVDAGLKIKTVIPSERIHLSGLIVAGHTFAKISKVLASNKITDARARILSIAKIVIVGLIFVAGYKYYQHLELEKARLEQVERDRKQAEAFGHNNMCGFAAEASQLIPELLRVYSRYGIDNLTIVQRQVSLVGVDSPFKVKELLSRISDKNIIEFPSRSLDAVSWVINPTELKYKNADPSPLRNFAQMKQTLVNDSIEKRYYLNYLNSNSNEWGVVRGAVEAKGTYHSNTLDTLCHRLGDYPFSVTKLTITKNKSGTAAPLRYVATFSTIGKL